MNSSRNNNRSGDGQILSSRPVGRKPGSPRHPQFLKGYIRLHRDNSGLYRDNGKMETTI